MKISWESSDSCVLINPAYSAADKARFERLPAIAQERWPGHLWLSTSGSSSMKWVGLSKRAVLASAAAVNQHLESHSTDRWIHPLPDFHVGGVGIWARSYLSGATVHAFKADHPGKWQAEAFFHYLDHHRGTLTALVPAQLYDLVMLGLKAPSSLRALIVGGGALLPAMYEKAIALGWPVLPSYGATECASQIATAPLARSEHLPPLQLLSHLQAKVQEERLSFSGHSLFSAYAYFEEEAIHFVDPKDQGWWQSEDRGEIHGYFLNIKGRLDSLIKIGGENVDLERLEKQLQTVRLQLALKADVTLVAMPDPRLGKVIHLAAADPHNDAQLDTLVQRFHQQVLPFERIRHIHFLPEFPRSPLGKILKSELIDRLCETV